jgi:hypothetical protein
MGFLDALRRTFGGTAARDREQARRLAEAWGLGESGAEDGVPSPDMTTEPVSSYDRRLWSNKLRLLLTEKLPVSRQEWDDVLADGQALGFEPDWIEQQQRAAFDLLIRKIVADGVVTPLEHDKIEQARSLVGLSEAEAEDTLKRVVDEARAVLGREIEGT